MSPVRFPPEIFAEIFSYLSPNDLTGVCRISHHVHAIAQPILYRSPNFRHGNHCSESLTIFINTLLIPGNESLANHVRSIAWAFPEIESSEKSATISALSTAAASRLGLEIPLVSGDAHVVLLLHLLPRLQNIEIAHFENDGILYNFMERIQPEFLSSLRSIRWLTFNGSTIRPQGLLAILMLPRIRNVIVRLTEDTEAIFRPDIRAGVSVVTHLNLAFGCISTSMLMTILKIPKALSHFSYMVFFGPELNLSAFGIALQPLKRSLTHLHLDFGLTDPNDNHDLSRATIGSIRDWPVLQSVTCALTPLLGRGRNWDDPDLLAGLLPLGIRYLEILRDEFWTDLEVVREVFVLLGQKRAMVDGLRNVVLYRDCNHSPVMRQRLRAAGMAVGVELDGNAPVSRGIIVPW